MNAGVLAAALGGSEFGPANLRGRSARDQVERQGGLVKVAALVPVRYRLGWYRGGGGR